MQANPTNDRLRFIAKTYAAKKPWVVLNMVQIVCATVGADRWYEEIRDRLSDLIPPDTEKDVGRFLRELLTWGRRTPSQDIQDPDTHVERVNEPDPEFVIALASLAGDLPQLALRAKADPIFPWMAQSLAKAYPVGPSPVRRVHDEVIPLVTQVREYGWLVTQLKRKGTTLALWFERTRPNLGDYTVRQAIKEADEWHAEEGPIPQGEIVAKLSDGWTAQKLTTKEQLDVEGERMQHCVGSYCDQASSGKLIIYSLRDAKGHPHVTIEVKHNRVQQTQGKQNEKPAEKYTKYVDEFKEWLEEKGVSTDKVPKHLLTHADIITTFDHDVEDEYLADYAQRWFDVSSDPDVVRGWLSHGMSSGDSDLAEGLMAEDVTPEQWGKFPPALHDKLSHGGGYPRDGDDLAAVGLMVVQLTERLADRDHPSDSPQTELPVVGWWKGGRIPGHEPIAPIKESDSGAVRRYATLPSIRFGKWETGHSIDESDDWLYPAEEWIQAGFSPKPDDASFVGPWFIHRFTPARAEQWWDAGIEDGNIAHELRARRVTPQMIQESGVDANRIEVTMQKKVGYGVTLTPKQVANEIVEVIDDAGLERNSGRRRTSRRVR